MWIRSQDKSVLTKVTGVNVCDNENGTYDIDGAYWRLGTYKTKKRALEVLDEIQGLIIDSWGYCTVGDGDIVTEGIAFYQMPEE